MSTFLYVINLSDFIFLTHKHCNLTPRHCGSDNKTWFLRPTLYVIFGSVEAQSDVECLGKNQAMPFVNHVRSWQFFIHVPWYQMDQKYFCQNYLTFATYLFKFLYIVCFRTYMHVYFRVWNEKLVLLYNLKFA